MKVTRLRLTLLGLLVAAGAACGITEPNEVPIHVEGWVRGAQAAAVAGAVVTLHDVNAAIGGDPQVGALATTTTNQQGDYVLTYDARCVRHPAGLRLVAYSAQHVTRDTVDVDCWYGVQRATFSLAP